MRPIDKTSPSQGESISFEFDLAHSPERVWRALTDPVLITKWLLPTIDFRLVPDAEFVLKADPKPGWDGTVKCRMLEIELLKKISWRWIVGDIDTIVTFTLAPTESGTCLSLVQSGFNPDQTKNFAGARYGWNMMGAKLVDLLARLP